MTHEERQAYREKVARYNALPPQKKEEIKKRIDALKTLPPEEQQKQREALRSELEAQGIIVPSK